MAELAYNNAKNASTGHTPFELNCGYHRRVSYEEDLDTRSKSKAADELPYCSENSFVRWQHHHNEESPKTP